MTIEDVWAEIPDVHCKGLCAETCGPIDCSRSERRLLRDRGIRLRALPLLSVEIGDIYTCPALVDGRCSVYDVRPTICRIWGAVESMPCEFGCKPDQYLTDDEARATLARAQSS